MIKNFPSYLRCLTQAAFVRQWRCRTFKCVPFEGSQRSTTAWEGQVQYTWDLMSSKYGVFNDATGFMAGDSRKPDRNAASETSKTHRDRGNKAYAKKEFASALREYRYTCTSCTRSCTIC